MKISDLDTVIKLAAKRSETIKAREFTTYGWGDHWFVQYQFDDQDPPREQSKIVIPVERVREYFDARIAAIDEQLEGLGVNMNG